MDVDEVGRWVASRQRGIRKQMNGWKMERLRMWQRRSNVRYWVQDLGVEGGRREVVVTAFIRPTGREDLVGIRIGSGKGSL